MGKMMRGLGEDVTLAFGSTSVHLLPERALWLPDHHTLVVADLHFGKVNHFRRAGLPVPLGANIKNAEQLIDLLNLCQPQHTYFLGDLFHSVYNDDWEAVGQIVRHFRGCRFTLIRGNHDILSEQQYVRHGIDVQEQAVVGDLLLTHEPLSQELIPLNQVNVSGHVHPAARLLGKGRQSLTLPCFWRSSNQLIVPAFGAFTGLAAVYPQGDDILYTIVDKRIMELRPPGENSGSQPVAS